MITLFSGALPCYNFPMAKQPETKFKEKVLPMLRKLPKSWFIKTQMLSLVGVPDIIGCVNGRFVALELKKSRKEAEKAHGGAVLQRHLLAKIRRAGGFADFCYPENWGEIHEGLSRIAVNDPLLAS